MRKRAGYAIRRKALRVERPYGSAGESDFVRHRGRTRRQLPVGLEPKRWCLRATESVRVRARFGEGSSSRRIMRRGAGGQHPGCRKAPPRGKAHARFWWKPCQARGEGASRRGRAKRARANSKRSPFSSHAARTAMARCRGLPLRTKVRGKSSDAVEARDPAESVIQT